MYDVPHFAFQAIGHSLLALAFGAAIMVAASLVAERILTRAAMRRVLWQATLVGLCVLVAFELTGANHALSSFFAPLSRPAASNIDSQATPAYPDDSRHGESVEPAPALPSAGYDLPAISAFHTSPLLFDNEDLAYLEPLSLPDDPGRVLSVTSPFIPRQTHAESDSLAQPVRNRLSMGSYRRQTVGNVASPARASVLHHALASVATVPKPSPDGAATRGLMLLWLGGACLIGGRALFARARLIQLRRQWWRNDDPELERLVEDLRCRIGMKQTVRIRVAKGLTAPVAFGILRPTILVPNDFTKRFSAIQQQVILAHELAHLAGSDPSWLLAGELIAALLWWHPLAHVARFRLLAASEQAADEASVFVPDGPDVLAECLVKLGRRLSGKPRLGWMAAEGSGLRSGLARRVQQLLKLSDRPAPHVTRRVPAASKPVAIMLLMVLTISCTLWARPKTSYAKGEEAMNVLKGSWRQSLAAVALTALLGPLTTDASGEESPDQPPKPAQLEDGSPVDQLLLAERGDRERGDRERGDRETGDREARERREGDRGREHREQEARERADRGREEHRERRTEESEELRQRSEEIEREKAELQRDAEARARELETESRKIQEQREEIAREIKEIQEHLAKRKKTLAVEAEGDEKEEAHEALEIEIDAIAGQLEWTQKYFERLTGRAEQLTRELGEHRANAQRRMAELGRESAEVRTQLARLEAARRGNPERAEIMKRIGELTREIGKLQRAGKHEEVQRLQAEMGELHSRLAGPRDRDRPEGREHARREGEERLAQMEREFDELRESGQHERAERLEVEIHTLRRRLAVPRGGDHPGPPPELQAKIEHLRVAVENLRAAGIHDQAEQIAEQIERITREHAPVPPERRDPRARPRGPRDEGRPEPGGEVAVHLRGEIEQLRRENEELRNMMQELREAMNELRERR